MTLFGPCVRCHPCAEAKAQLDTAAHGAGAEAEATLSPEADEVKVASQVSLVQRCEHILRSCRKLQAAAARGPSAAQPALDSFGARALVAERREPFPELPELPELPRRTTAFDLPRPPEGRTTIEERVESSNGEERVKNSNVALLQGELNALQQQMADLGRRSAVLKAALMGPLPELGVIAGPPQGAGEEPPGHRILWADISDDWDLDAAEADYFPEVQLPRLQPGHEEGEVVRTTLAIDVTAGPPKGFATVECLTEREAEKTVSLLNDSRIDGNRAKVELLKDPRDLTPGKDCPRRGRKKHRVRSATAPLLAVAALMGPLPGLADTDKTADNNSIDVAIDVFGEPLGSIPAHADDRSRQAAFQDHREGDQIMCDADAGTFQAKTDGRITMFFDLPRPPEAMTDGRAPLQHSEAPNAASPEPQKQEAPKDLDKVLFVPPLYFAPTPVLALVGESFTLSSASGSVPTPGSFSSDFGVDVEPICFLESTDLLAARDDGSHRELVLACLIHFTIAASPHDRPVRTQGGAACSHMRNFNEAIHMWFPVAADNLRQDYRNYSSNDPSKYGCVGSRFKRFKR